MNEDPTGTPHWDIVPSPELEQKVSSWLRGMIRFIVESTDEPDTTPDRFERTLGITVREGDYNWYCDDSSDPAYICQAGVTPFPAQVPGAHVTLRAADHSARGTRALVRVPDSRWVESRLRDSAFDLRPEFPAHGGCPLAIHFSRGHVTGSLWLRGRRGETSGAMNVTRAVMSWSGPAKS